MKNTFATIAALVIWLTVIISLNACNKNNKSIESTPYSKNYKQEMRNFVQEISVYAKNMNPSFVVIPQNGAELISTTGNDEGAPDMQYINAIDGMGQEGLNYGYETDNQATPHAENAWMRIFLDMAKTHGNVKILITDYCSTPSNMDSSYAINHAQAYISFSANHRALDNIPDYPTPIYNENAAVISKLEQAQNFLYLINPDKKYPTQQAFVDAVKNTNYDVVIMDLFYNGQTYTKEQIEALKQKANGGKRLLICYMSIGEAEDYRYYWTSDWSVGHPSFIVAENPNWEGNYIVKYWQSEWKKIIFGNDNAYLKKILDAQFDGVYLDIIDAFEYFENETLKNPD